MQRNNPKKLAIILSMLLNATTLIPTSAFATENVRLPAYNSSIFIGATDITGGTQTDSTDINLETRYAATLLRSTHYDGKPGGDWYQITIAEPMTIEILCNLVCTQSLGDKVCFTAYDVNFKKVFTHEDQNIDQIEVLNKGTYYINIYTYSTTYHDDVYGFSISSIQNINDFIEGGVKGKATEIKEGANYTSYLREENSEEWYTFTLDEDQTTDLTFSFLDGYVGTGNVTLYDSKYKKIESFTDDLIEKEKGLEKGKYNLKVTHPTPLWKYDGAHEYGAFTFSVKKHIEVQTLPFTDVDENKWYIDKIRYVYQKELMTGSSETLFRPDAPISRAEAVQVLYAAAGKPAVDTSYTGFSDVPSKKWYSAAIVWANETGVANGKGKGFDPDTNITRQELSLMLKKFAEVMGKSTNETSDLSDFNDEDDVADWAVDGLRWAHGVGIVNGRGGNMIAPGENASRAEYATMIKALYENVLS